MVSKAVCVIRGDTVQGVIKFEQDSESGPCRIHGEIGGLKQGLHGFHVHEFGDTTNGCISAGPHYNPFKKTHAGPKDDNRHVGDLGNVEVGADGIGKVDMTDNLVKILGNTSVVGRTMVIHEKVDDLGRGEGGMKEESLKTGNAGPRLGCGVIGWTSSQ